MTIEKLLERAVERVGLHEGAELQLVVGDMTFCIYRKKSSKNPHGFYYAEEYEVRGPSGRSKTTRLSWNKRSGSAVEVPSLASLAAKIEEDIEEYDADFEAAWLVNPGAGFEQEQDLAELGLT